MNIVWGLLQVVFFFGTLYFGLSVFWNYVTENNGGHMVNTSWKINLTLFVTSLGLAVLSGTMIT